MFHQSSFDCMTFLPYLSLYVNILFSNVLIHLKLQVRVFYHCKLWICKIVKQNFMLVIILQAVLCGYQISYSTSNTVMSAIWANVEVIGLRTSCHYPDTKKEMKIQVSNLIKNTFL